MIPLRLYFDAYIQHMDIFIRLECQELIKNRGFGTTWLVSLEEPNELNDYILLTAPYISSKVAVANKIQYEFQYSYYDTGGVLEWTRCPFYMVKPVSTFIVIISNGIEI